MVPSQHDGDREGIQIKRRDLLRSVRQDWSCLSNLDPSLVANPLGHCMRFALLHQAHMTICSNVLTTYNDCMTMI